MASGDATFRQHTLWFFNESKSRHRRDRQFNHIRNNERFVLRYTDSRLNNEDDQFNNNGLFVISDESIQIVSNNLKIKNIEVFDVLGRSLVSKTNLDSNSVFVDEIVKSNNVLIVNIVLENDIKISRKVLF